MRILIAAFLLLGACAHLDLSNGPATAKGESHIVEMNSFLWGFIPGPKVPPISVLCPQAQMQTAQLEMTSADAWLTVVTLGIYVPHRVTVVCSK